MTASTLMYSRYAMLVNFELVQILMRVNEDFNLLRAQ
jgi:hypothetical protein